MSPEPGTVYYTYLDSPIGPILVAGDGEAVARIGFSTGHQVLQPGTAWVDDAVPLRAVTEQLEQYFAGERRDFDLRLAMQGTAFQKRAWEILRTIPFGEAWSYGQVAKALGSPGAARAVGGALPPCDRRWRNAHRFRRWPEHQAVAVAFRGCFAEPSISNRPVNPLLAARGGSLMGLVTPSCGQMQGSLTQAILEASSRKANAADAHKSP